MTGVKGAEETAKYFVIFFLQMSSGICEGNVLIACAPPPLPPPPRRAQKRNTRRLSFAFTWNNSDHEVHVQYGSSSIAVVYGTASTHDSRCAISPAIPARILHVCPNDPLISTSRPSRIRTSSPARAQHTLSPAPPSRHLSVELRKPSRPGRSTS